MMRTTRQMAFAVMAGLLLTGACSAGVAGQPAAGTAISSPPPGDEVGALVVEELVVRPMQTEIDAFWDEIFGLAGLSGKVVAPMTFLAPGETFPCGSVTLTADDPNGPAYCAAEDAMVTSNRFMADLGDSRVLNDDATFVDSAYDVGVFFLLAHEWGHNVILELAEEEGLDLTDVEPVQIENLSDCLAGITIAGVPRVFEDKDPDSMLAYAEALGEPFAGPRGSAQERRDAVAAGLGTPFEDRQQFVDDLDDCVRIYAPSIDRQR